MNPGWNIKSASDTDVVWAKYDKKGRETGEYRYEDHVGESVTERFVPGVAPKRPRWPWAAVTAAALVVGGVASRVVL